MGGRLAVGPAGPRGPLTVPGSKWKLMSNTTWATRMAQDRLAWMW